MMVPGHELWHPNPDFYYKPGGGPMLDMGPYYLTCLVNMLGPVASVSGAAKSSYPNRIVGSGPRQGESFSVDVPTHISGMITFQSGAAVTITTSFDVWKHSHSHIEIYGSTGSMLVPDPNQFQGDVQVSQRKGDWTRCRRATSTATAITASSGSPTWRRPSSTAARIGQTTR